MRNEAQRSKRYLYYLLGILSLFSTFRSYTLDGPRTTVKYVEFIGGHDFICWRGTLADGLMYLIGNHL